MDEINENAKRLAEQATGSAKATYSDGKISEDDEGDLFIAIGVDREHKLLCIEFGKPVRWIGLPLAEAKTFRDSLSDYIKKVEGL